MAPRLPQKADVEIYAILNRAIETGSAICDVQLRELINKAGTLGVPNKYACLSAVYSYALDCNKVVENAVKAIKMGVSDEECVFNTLSALSNMKLFSEIVKIAKKYPVLLGYNVPRGEIYDAAIRVLELDYCEYISEKYSLSLDSRKKRDCRSLRNHFCNDSRLIKQAGEYLNAAYVELISVLKNHKYRTTSINFGVEYYPDGECLEVEINIYSADYYAVDDIINIEEQWFKKLSTYQLSDEKLASISFGIRWDDDFSRKAS
ncbi:hypothetical protein [Aeromonas veronii]|uniref:hypothetical protein n=1 Tax=Aeromonas veronii TaxID=654 RepID=UPI003BA3A015